MNVSTPPPVRTEPETGAHSARTRHLLEAPVVPLLLRMAWPNILIMVAQASTGLIETWWLSHLGTQVLAGMALVFPPVMLMQMVSNGAMGGGISSAIARALGRGDRDGADALVLHAIAINIAIALVLAAVMLLWGRPVYGALGGEGGELEAALAYSDVVFAGMPALWLMAGFASIIRGTGNMLFPALVICGGVVLLIPLSPLLIFGFGPLPAMGVAGGGMAFVIYNAAGALVMGWYIFSGRNVARLRWVRLRWPLFREILRIGLVAAISSLQTNITIALATALVAGAASVDAVAGFGTGARLEYLLVPLTFGLGGPMVALVGTSMGAGLHDRALRIALIGGGIAFALTETIGILAAIWPAAWLSLFSSDPAMIETGSAYLRIVGPAYGFFGLGMCLYFASQGAGKLLWPLLAGTLRVLIAVGGGWLALSLTGSLSALFGALALGLVAYGLTITAAVKSGAWFRMWP